MSRTVLISGASRGIGRALAERMAEQGQKVVGIARTSDPTPHPCGSRTGTRARAVGLLVALIAFVLVAMVAQVGVPWYFGTHLGLDNGIGG